jgi:hypothetical protein
MKHAVTLQQISLHLLSIVLLEEFNWQRGYYSMSSYRGKKGTIKQQCATNRRMKI